MLTINERHFQGTAGVPVDHIRVGIDEGVYYPGVNSCLSVTLVWVGQHDVIAGAHFGMMYGATNAPAAVVNFTDVPYVMGAATGVLEMRTRAAAAQGVALGALPAPDYALYLGEGVGVPGSHWEANGVLPALRAAFPAPGTPNNPALDEYDTGGATCNLRVNRPSGWSLFYRGTWTARAVVAGVAARNRSAWVTYKR
jgi:hypothetical protein